MIVPLPYRFCVIWQKESKPPGGLLFGADGRRITYHHLLRRPQGKLER